VNILDGIGHDGIGHDGIGHDGIGHDGIGHSIGEMSLQFPYAPMRYVGPARHPWFPRSLRLSVILVTQDRPAGLAATLHSIYAQTSIPFELIVVDQSTLIEHARQTQDEFASPFAVRPRGMRFVYDHSASGGDKSQGRNRGTALARGDIFLFLDDDVLLEPHFIQELLKAYDQDAFLDGVSGTVVPLRPESWWERLSPFGSKRDDNVAMSFRAESVQGLRFEEGMDFCKLLLQRGPAHLMVHPAAILHFQTT
jgi:hypothetical protein